jgi:hypothetical protein
MRWKPGKVGVALKLGFLELNGEWAIDENQRKAAWELYVQLATRVPVADLHDDEGLLREALNSLYSLFATTREILTKYGPDVAISNDDGVYSFGYLAVALLNGALRPFLATWHPALLAHEADKKGDESATACEARWADNLKMRQELRDLRDALMAYAILLGEATGAPAILQSVEDTRRAASD